RGGLHQVAHGAGGHRVEQVALLLGDGEHHDAGLVAAGPGHLAAAAVGHVEVAHDQVGLRPADDGDGLVGVGRLAHHPEVVAQVGPDAVPPDGVVVGQDDGRLDHVHGSHSTTSVP